MRYGHTICAGRHRQENRDGADGEQGRAGPTLRGGLAPGGGGHSQLTSPLLRCADADSHLRICSAPSARVCLGRTFRRRRAFEGVSSI